MSAWVVEELTRYAWLLPGLWAAKAAFGWVIWRRVRAWRARRALVVPANRNI